MKGMVKMTVYEKLAQVQAELNAPKNLYNSYGGYSYRSCESILEAVKPLLKKVKAAIKLNDIVTMVGDRHYINAQAFFIDVEKPGEFIVAEAFAREPADKKGMDAAQITGTASSYARKYALNGLLLIDDAKDPDTDEYKKTQDAKAEKASTKKKAPAEDVDTSALDEFINNGQLKTLEMLLDKAGITQEKFNSIYGLVVLSELPAAKYDDAVHKLEKAIIANKEG